MAPTNSSDCDGVLLCKSCQQAFYTKKGLASHMCFRGEQWLLPHRREEPQVKGKQRGGGAQKAKRCTGVGAEPTPALPHSVCEPPFLILLRAVLQRPDLPRGRGCRRSPARPELRCSSLSRCRCCLGARWVAGRPPPGAELPFCLPNCVEISLNRG